MIYLDNASNTKIDNIVFAEMLPYLKGVGSPSSLHSVGRKCKKAIEEARQTVAKAINAKPEQIFFVNSATEGNNWIISNFNHVLCSQVEHHSVLNNPKCTPIFFDNLANTIHKQHPDLVTCMYVNNEIGAIYNIKEMAEISHKMGIPFHTDAVQAYSHIPVDVVNLNIDSLEPIYLSYFIKWNSYSNYIFAKSRGFSDLKSEWDRTHTIESFDQVDSVAYIVHAWMKYPKFGHAMATDYAARLVRYGLMSRDKAIELVKERDHALDPRCVEDFCNFIGISKSKFWQIIEKHYNKDIFAKNEFGEYKIKYEIS